MMNFLHHMSALYVDGADHDGLDYSREAGIPLEKLVHLVVSCLGNNVTLHTHTHTHTHAE